MVERLCSDDLRQAGKNIEFLADPTLAKCGSGAPPYGRELRFGLIDRLSRRYPRMVFHLVTGSGDAAP